MNPVAPPTLSEDEISLTDLMCQHQSEPLRTGRFPEVALHQNRSRTVQNGSAELLSQPQEKLRTDCDPSAEERALIRRWYHQLGSKSAVCRTLYGYKNGKTMGYVTAAIEEAEQAIG